MRAMKIVLAGVGLILIFGALNWVSNRVEDAFSSLTVKMKIPATIAGATLLAIGGSASEFFTALNAAVFFKIFEIGLVTIIWSAIFNLCVITGLVGLMSQKPIPLAKAGIRRDILFYFLAAIMLITSVWDGMLTRGEGWIFCGFYALYLLVLFLRRKHRPTDEKIEHFHLPDWHIVLAIVGGLAGIGILSWLMIQAGLTLAAGLGISIAAVSALLFAFGTSIADTFIAASATRKGNGSGAVASIFGSNTFDIALCLGVPLVIVGKTPVEIGTINSSLVMLVLSILVVGFFVMNDWKISRLEAGLSLGTFGVFLTAFLLGI